MAQPVGIFSKIKISEENYKKYLKKVANLPLANAIFENLSAGYRNYYVFKYLKKEGCFYAYFYFYHGHAGFLKQCIEWQLLKDVEPYLEDDSKGYLIATLDSMNFVNDFLFAFDIEGRKLKQHTFPETELKTIWEDVNKYFFKYVDTEFRVALYKQQIVDKKIVDKVLKLTDEHRIKNLKENLHLATKESPVELFYGYFYDGTDFYSSKGYAHKTVFPDINILSLKEMPYGLSDGNYVIVCHNLVNDYWLKTNGDQFKKYSKYGTTYYTSLEAVYDDKLCLIKNSDGKSFRLLSEYVGEDKNYIYFLGELIPKEEVGEYKINATGYFNVNIVLYSKKQIRVGTFLISNIDAGTFEVVIPDGQQLVCDLPNPSGIHLGTFILHCRDKWGELVIYNFNPLERPKIERINAIDEFVQQAGKLLAGIERKS